MRYVVIIILVILIMLLGVQAVILFKKEIKMQKDLSQMQEKMNSLVKENKEFQAKIDYFSQPENLEKELRAKYNYKGIGEEMMIIVP